ANKLKRSITFMPIYSAGAVLLFVIGLFVSISLTLHVIFAIGLSDIAKDRGEPKHWLAWIPMWNIILIMMLVEKEDRPLVKGKMVIYFGLLVIISLFTLPIFASFDTPLLSNPFMPMIIPGFWTLFVFRMLIRDYTKYPTVHMILALITIGFSMPFQLYGFRNTMLDTKKSKSKGGRIT